MKAIQKTVLSLLLLLVVGVLVSCQSVNEPAVQEESSNRKGLGNTVTSSWSFVGDTAFTPDPVGSKLSISTNSSGRPYVAFLRNTAGGFKVMVMR